MAPEILLPDLRPSEATISDLKAVDIWALGMVLFVTVNPSISHPYCSEIKEEMEKNQIR